MSEHAPLREVDVWGKQLCDCGDYYPCPTVILTDLIAELRPYERYTLTEYTVIKNAVDRAEARLREVTGDDRR